MKANLQGSSLVSEGVTFEGTPVTELDNETLGLIEGDLTQIAKDIQEILDQPDLQNAPTETKLQRLVTELKANADTIATMALIAGLAITTGIYNDIPSPTYEAEVLRGFAMFLGGATVTQFIHAIRKMPWRQNT